MPDTTSKTAAHKRIAATMILLVVAAALPTPATARDRAPLKRFGVKMKNNFKTAGTRVTRGAKNLRDRFRNNHDDGNHDDGKIRSLLSRIRGRGSDLPDYDGDWQWPVAEDDGVIISSEFGPRWGKEHRGLDLAGETGVPIYAAADGKVVYSGNGLRGYGNVVIIQHDDNLTSLYAHNEKLLVKEGATVNAGERIAALGSTGRSTGPHLHFEIREGEDHVDPRRFLPEGSL